MLGGLDLKSLIVGNGINIQFGGSENTNKSIILRAVKGSKEVDYPKHIIVYDPDLLLTMIGRLFREVQALLRDGYERFAVSSDEKAGLKELRNRYKKYPNLKFTDIGFEDYYLIYDLFCHKNEIVNPEKYNIREAIKCFFLHSIYNKGKVNQIYKSYPPKLLDFFNNFENIYTTNYDKNIENFSGKQVFYLHGAFHIKKDVYNPESMRNKLSDRPVDNCVIDDNYYYLYSNVLTDYSGYSKEFSINQGSYANSSVEKFCKAYIENETVKKDVDSWKSSENKILNNLYESIMLKLKNPELRFDETYPIEQFQNIKGCVEILGLSPFNDTHIFKGINDNSNIENVIYYYHDTSETDVVNKLFNNIKITFVNVRDLWSVYK